MNEDKATRYHRSKRRITALSLLVTGALLVALIETGASEALRDVAERIAALLRLPSPFIETTIVVIYIVTFATLNELFVLPLVFYSGFWLEHQYGLSTETFRAWLWDQTKGFVLGLVLIIVATTCVYATLRHWPGAWWAIAAAGFSLAGIVLANLAPVLLLPLFYRFQPLERESLRDRLTKLAARAGARVIGVYEWKLGDKTRTANAALVGLRGTRRILVSDTLLEKYSEDEIEVILAHELAHHVHGDIWKGMVYESLALFGGLFVADRVLRFAVSVLDLRGPADVAGVPVLVLTAGVLSVMGAPLANAISRHIERRADRYALDLTSKPDAFVSAMRRLGAQNLAEEHPSRLAELLFYTHPPVQQRIAFAAAWGTGEVSAATDRASE